ncbi:uncharacterized protein PGTG_15158 [Puccinia graminis f. sp. tritici CRL 75-36-700-3]|uniref:mannan endo-1,4-beta-mannosidase n=1 Tax=Puccinia graminis f. sp. tritici (strain CRL 75-36-700-3 / race SCCL) TaxID=418459 RepID=E3KXJ7_PUCGT|nr:uncharacterized protein PGTG_15158 [Puccinia graminis f. sp. tritici CRL 75-36-700-3]EFP88955.2 hypothetical protein PGTG_15158 [Puccinia graminis f. sp. tritici CRL 75-36-700-3]
MRKVQTGYLPWAFCLLRLAWGSMAEVQAPFNTTTGSPSTNVRVNSRLPGSSSSPAGFVSALGSKHGFVSAPGDGHLYLNGELFDFRSFNCPTLFDGGKEFQARDLVETISAFGSPVTRTYTLHVANTMFSDGQQPPAWAHILGWNDYTNDWNYNETNWRDIDKALDLARQHGVRVIIPIINQDYGPVDSDFVGNFNDLIRHRYNIQNYTEAQRTVDWFTDREMIASYKQIITYFLNRINTYNGIRIGDDQTILAFETGNEMNWGRENQTIHDRPAPANWTIEIAKHIKSLAPKTLVMDGSYSRNPTAAWEDEVLDSPFMVLAIFVLIKAYKTKYERTEKRSSSASMAFVDDKVEVYDSFYKNATCAGALIWSLRSHSEDGGFVTHGEGNNIFSYHAPGFRNQTSDKFDTQEADVISFTYDASYTVLGLEPPPKPVPGAPDAFLVTNGTHAGLSWRGSAWAQQYEVYGAFLQDLRFNLISQSVQDNVEAGQLFVPLDPHDPTKPIKITLPAPIPERSHAGFIDTKWCLPGSPAPCPLEVDFPKQVDDPSNPRSNQTQHTIFSDAIDTAQNIYKRLLPMGPPLPTIPLPQLSLSFTGGWFSVRAISADGTPGGLSQSVFLKTDWNANAVN